ncbi:MAG: beta-ketoacyl-ACP synthase II [Gemmatimonadetes bacterium]|nr:beta-ketoacyl-ACP synthase II [Gemmatimonadota bacterium]
MPRVVITGIGCVTPIGTGVDGLWSGLKARRSAVGAITRFDAEPFKSKIAAEVPDFRPQDHLTRKAVRRLDRFSQFGLVAAIHALEDSRIALERENLDRIGVMMGSALGGIAHAEAQAASYMTRGLRYVDPSLATSVFAGAVSCNIAIHFGATGPNSTNAMSCASGAIALGNGFDAIRADRADVMVVGGAEAPLSPLGFGAFTLIRAMSTRNDDPGRASRPFDQGRDGFVMGEGSAVLVLERRDRALARGACVYAEVLGYGLTNDAHHMTAPRPDGRQAARAVELALHDAHVAPHEIEYINAHGSSTPLNDSTETLAIKHVFGDHAFQVPISGTKGYYGHALGASGAIEAATCALGMKRGWLPPTVNLETADPDCDLNYLANGGLDRCPRLVVSNSFGFGGVNAALVFGAA